MQVTSRKKRGCLFSLGAVAALVISFSILVMLILRSSNSGLTIPENGIGLLEISGVIMNARPYLEQLKDLTETNPVPALLVRIDSPGGGAAASQEVFYELQRLRQQGVPVVVSMGGVAASGGYYIACAGDKIFANPGTITGSIGVISELPNTQELFKMLGIRFDVVKSGKFKDAGSPSRALSVEDRRLLQELVDDIHQQFKEDVAQSRLLTDGAEKLMTDGRVVTGRRAVELGLVDTLGNFNDAVRFTAKLAKIKGTPVLIERKQRNRIREWFTTTATEVGYMASHAFFEKKYLLYQR